MWCGVRGKLGVGVLLVATTHAWRTSDARADDAPTEAVRIDFAAPATCPPREAFLAGVRSRTARMRLVGASEPARTFVVVLEDAARGARGRVTIRDRDGRELRREVEGASCEEVADVLSLVVALAIDPHASLAPHAPASTAAAPATPSALPTAPAPSPSSVPAPSSTAAPPAPAADEPPVRARPGRREAPVDPTARTPWSWATGVGASASTAVVPSLLFGPRVFVEVGGVVDVWSSPRLRLSFERTASGRLDAGGGAVRFTWTVARADGCVAGWRDGHLRFSPCLGVEVGALEAAGADVDHARGATRPWVAVGPVARFSWAFAGPFFLELDASARAALVRSQFFFQPNTSVYDAPVLGVGLGLALGSSF